MPRLTQITEKKLEQETKTKETNFARNTWKFYSGGEEMLAAIKVKMSSSENESEQEHKQQ